MTGEKPKVLRRKKIVTVINDPWNPAVPTRSEAMATKAMHAHNASPEQQRIFLDFVYRLTGMGDLEFRPESDRASAFASGKRFVAMQINWVARLTSESIKQLEP